MLFDFSFHPEAPNWWSPSSYNRLYSCSYRFALSTDRVVYSKFSKPNTFAALGTASHRLTERAWSNEFSQIENVDLDERLLQAWNQEVAIQFEKMQSAWSPSNVPQPHDWPFYSINSRRTIRRIKSEIVAFRERDIERTNFNRPWIEHELRDEEARLKGTPDRVIFFEGGFVIQDLKTGFKVKEMSESHRRQLLLYAHLVGRETRKRPLRIEVVKSDGQILGEEISSEDVDKCLEGFKKMTEDFTLLVRQRQVDHSLAEPDPDLCGHCHYRPICKPFWTDSSSAWGSSRGIVGQVLRINNETTLTLEQIYPGEGAGDVLGLSNVQHSVLVGDVISVVNIYQQGFSLRGRWDTILTVLGSEK